MYIISLYKQRKMIKSFTEMYKSDYASKLTRVLV